MPITLPVIQPKASAKIPIAPNQVFYDPERDGITFSMLKTWKDCREQARLALRGWTPRMNGMAITFGSVVHELLQRVAEQTKSKQLTELPPPHVIHEELHTIEQMFKQENPLADADALQYMELTMLLAEPLLPLYFEHWKEDFTNVNWLHVEKEFKLPLQNLPTRGPYKSTFLRGKMDGAFYLKGSLTRPWLFETKTKSRIDEGNLVDILPFEEQVNIYFLALRALTGQTPRGVRYNILRRPGLRQKKTETLPMFAKRIIADIKARPDWYFMRLEMVVGSQELDKFELELLDTIVDFLDWWAGETGHYRNSNHCENKYGTCPMLPICSSKNYAPFFKRETVFRELMEV